MTLIFLFWISILHFLFLASASAKSLAGVNGSLSTAGDVDLENWMANLSQSIRNWPITYISIPGSHDSFTSGITDTSDVSPDAEDIVKELAGLGPLIKMVIKNWSVTQSYMAADQLKRGVRYFDLRIATKSDSDDLYIVHGLYSVTVRPIFDEIKAFLDGHPQEIVILDCQHFYAFSNSVHTGLVSMLTATFGSKLLPYAADMSTITLDYMTTQNSFQVIVIYREDSVVSGNPLLWPSSDFPNPWADTVSQNTLFDALDEGIRDRNSKIGFISQCLLTPSATFILENVGSTLKEKCAQDLESARTDWINKQSSGPGGMNIIIVDFIELSDNQYAKDVINHNEQLLLSVESSLKAGITL